MLTLTCKACGETNAFDQPYPYHAGFGHQGFLYNDAGTLTLVWSSFDPTYESIVGEKHPWMLSSAEQRSLEEALMPSPGDDNWRFSNPPRCMVCRQPIGESITTGIHYYVYRGSVLTETADGGRGLEACVRGREGSG